MRVGSTRARKVRAVSGNGRVRRSDMVHPESDGVVSSQLGPVAFDEKCLASVMRVV